MNNKKNESKQPGMTAVAEINNLVNEGIQQISLIIRHSARHYSNDPNLEPFMGLTEQGKQFCVDMGKSLPLDFSVNFYSSYIGRCIETAYLIDKGVTSNGGTTSVNVLSEDVSPFYIVQFDETIRRVMKNGLEGFIRDWVSNNIPEGIIDDAGRTAMRMAHFMKTTIENSSKKSLTVSVTHDWNMFSIKEKILGLKIEDEGPVEYLEGILVYKKDGEYFMKNHQCLPVKLFS